MPPAPGAVVAALAATAAALLAGGCRTHAAGPAPTSSCRTIAVAGERWLAAAPAAERDDTLRFAVELIDGCQAPGIGPALTTCLGGAATAAGARTCPGVIAVHRGAVPRALPHAGAPDDDDDELEPDDEF
ncbi:MAG: hypothetical protein IPL61_09815 [Myxococcales bacterium]|nr:hypothetical protein [Myxococcales bacterium]